MRCPCTEKHLLFRKRNSHAYRNGIKTEDIDRKALSRYPDDRDKITVDFTLRINSAGYFVNFVNGGGLRNLYMT